MDTHDNDARRTAKKKVRRNLWIILIAGTVLGLCIDNYSWMMRWADSIGSDRPFVGLENKP